MVCIGCNSDVSVSQWVSVFFVLFLCANAFFIVLNSWWETILNLGLTLFLLLFCVHCILMLPSLHIYDDRVWLPWFNLKSCNDCNSFVNHVNRNIEYAIASCIKKKKKPMKSCKKAQQTIDGESSLKNDDFFRWNNFILRSNSHWLIDYLLWHVSFVFWI